MCVLTVLQRMMYLIVKSIEYLCTLETVWVNQHNNYIIIPYKMQQKKYSTHSISDMFTLPMRIINDNYNKSAIISQSQYYSYYKYVNKTR